MSTYYTLLLFGMEPLVGIQIKLCPIKPLLPVLWNFGSNAKGRHSTKRILASSTSWKTQLAIL